MIFESEADTLSLLAYCPVPHTATRLRVALYKIGGRQNAVVKVGGFCCPAPPEPRLPN